MSESFNNGPIPNILLALILIYPFLVSFPGIISSRTRTNSQRMISWMRACGQGMHRLQKINMCCVWSSTQFFISTYSDMFQVIKQNQQKCSHVVRMEDKIKLVQRWEGLWAFTDAPSKLPKVSLIRWDVRSRGVRRHHFLWWGLGTSTPRLHSWPEKPMGQQTQTFLLMML